MSQGHKAGSRVTLRATPPGIRGSLPAANWVKGGEIVTLAEFSSGEGTLDVVGVREGDNLSIYDFNIEGKAPKKSPRARKPYCPTPEKMAAAAILGWVSESDATAAASLHTAVVTDCVCRACGNIHDIHRSIFIENKTNGRCAVVCGPNCPGLGGVSLGELKGRPELTVVDGSAVNWDAFRGPGKSRPAGILGGGK